MRVVGVAVVLSIVACAGLARAQDDAPTAEPPVAPAEPPVAPADDPALGAADAADADDLGWEPDQRGVTGEPAPPEPQERGGGTADIEEDAVLTAGAAEASYATGPVLWIDAGLGGSWIDLTALSDDRLLPQSTGSSAGGVALSLGGGIQVGPFTAGARGTLGIHGPYDLAAMVFEVGARVPMYLLDSPNAFTFRAAAGWSWLTSSAFEAEHDEAVLPVGGPILEVGIGADQWLSDDVTLGFAADGLLLFSRRAESTCEEPGGGGECMVDGLDFAKPGSAVGLGARLRVVLGVHF